MSKGSEGDAAYEAERQRRVVANEQRIKQWRAPWRFRLKKNEQADIVILDDDLGPVVHEHERWNSKANTREHEACPGNWETCPLCENDDLAGFSRRTWIMFLSIIDLRPYTSKNGEHRERTRKLIAVKFDQRDFFKRLKEREGTLRGVHLLMVRGADNRSSVIGTPEFVTRYEEAVIVEEFAHAEVRNDKNEVMKEANEDCYPYQYGKIFTRPSAEHLRSLYGGAAPAGSREFNRSDAPANEWGSNDPGQGQAAGQQPPWEGERQVEATPEQPRSSGGIQRRSTTVESEDDGNDEPASQQSRPGDQIPI